jgi:fluoroacetyl-CoA thioesterase
MRVQLDHLIPVPVGLTVLAEATLERVEGRRLTFTVSVNNERGLVAAGKVTRVLVHRQRFLDKAQ